MVKNVRYCNKGTEWYNYVKTILHESNPKTYSKTIETLDEKEYISSIWKKWYNAEKRQKYLQRM